MDRAREEASQESRDQEGSSGPEGRLGGRAAWGRPRRPVPTEGRQESAAHRQPLANFSAATVGHWALKWEEEEEGWGVSVGVLRGNHELKAMGTRTEGTSPTVDRRPAFVDLQPKASFPKRDRNFSTHRPWHHKWSFPFTILRESSKYPTKRQMALIHIMPLPLNKGDMKKKIIYNELCILIYPHLSIITVHQQSPHFFCQGSFR